MTWPVPGRSLTSAVVGRSMNPACAAVRGSPVARLILTRKWSGLPTSSDGSSTASDSFSGVPARSQGTADTSSVPRRSPSGPTIAGYDVSVSRRYARGSVSNSAVPSLRISRDASASALASTACAASPVNSSPSFHCANTSRHSSRRLASASLVHVLLRPVSLHVTSVATSSA